MLKAATKVIIETKFKSLGLCYENIYGNYSGYWDTENENLQIIYTIPKCLYSLVDSAFQSRLQYWKCID
jgi:hypothetical protein